MPVRLTDDDLNTLNLLIEEDYRGAVADHMRRMERFRGYYRRWRNRVDPPAPGEEHLPNFSVPVTQWHTLAKMATALEQLLGEDAEIIAVPVGPSDQRIVHKISRFMQWRMFDSMDILQPLAVFLFRLVLFGRAHAYAPWREDQPWYSGPDFRPLWPGELVVPAEDATSIHDFSFVIRRVWLTPQQLLDGEREGRYFDIKKNWERIVNLSQNAQWREDQPDKQEKDEAEGVTFDGSLTGKGTVEVHEWYGSYRPWRDGKPGFEEHELVCRRLPDLNLLVGADSLDELYPQQQRKRPFVEGALIEDGSYWGMGFGELLESIEDETTANHRLFTRAMQLGIGPVIFFKPTAGFNPDTFSYEPDTCIPSEDPAGVNAITLRADLQGAIVKEQAVLGYGEKVTGQSDQTLGRAIDRPNAPKTASGQIALIEQGNIRASLDVKMLRESLRKILRHFWDLETSFGDGEVFFRVTEEDAKGLFDVRHGGATITPQERAGRYDFDIKFATSYWDREARKARQIELYGLDLQNPLIVQNPRALWMITNQLHRAMGDLSFSDIVPEPPDIGLPKNPREEWAMILQGEDVEPNPADNDDLHLMDHMRRLKEHQASPNPDQPAIEAMITHIMAHKEQKQQKMMMQALTASLTESLRQNTQDPSLGGLNAGGQAVSLMDLHNVLGDLTGQGQQRKTARAPIVPGEVTA